VTIAAAAVQEPAPVHQDDSITDDLHSLQLAEKASDMLVAAVLTGLLLVLLLCCTGMHQGEARVRQQDFQGIWHQLHQCSAASVSAAHNDR
jgi:hypothetical protein